MSLNIDKLYVTQRDVVSSVDPSWFKPFTVILDNDVSSLGLAYAIPSIHATPDVIIEFYNIARRIFIPIFRFNISNTIKRDCNFRCFSIADVIRLSGTSCSDKQDKSIDLSPRLIRQPDDNRHCQEEILTIVSEKELCGINFITGQVMFLVNLDTDIHDQVLKSKYEFTEIKFVEDSPKVKNLYILTKQNCRMFAIKNIVSLVGSTKHQFEAQKEHLIHEAKGYMMHDMYLTPYKIKTAEYARQVDTHYLVVLFCSDSTLKFNFGGENLLSYKLDTNCVSLIENCYESNKQTDSPPKKVFIYKTASGWIESATLIQNEIGELKIDKHWKIMSSQASVSPWQMSSSNTSEFLCPLANGTLLLVFKQQRFFELYSFVENCKTQDDIDWLGVDLQDMSRTQEINWINQPCLIQTIDLGSGLMPVEVDRIYYLDELDIIVIYMLTGQIFILNRSASTCKLVEAIASDQHIENQVQNLKKMCDTTQRFLHNHQGMKRMDELDWCNITIPPKTLMIKVKVVIPENGTNFLSVECNLPMEQIIITSTAVIHLFECKLPNVISSHVVNDHTPYQNHAFISSTRNLMDYASSDTSGLNVMGNVTSWAYFKMQPVNKLALPINCTEGYPGRVGVYMMNGDSDRFIHTESTMAYTEFTYVHPLCLHKKLSCDIIETISIDDDTGFDISQKSEDMCHNSIDIKGNFEVSIALDWLSKCLPEIDSLELEILLKSVSSNRSKHEIKENSIDLFHNDCYSAVRLIFKSVVLDTKLCVRVAPHHIRIISDNIVAVNVIKDVIMSEATKQSITIDMASRLDDKNSQYLLIQIHRKLKLLHLNDDQEIGSYKEALDKVNHMESVLNKPDDENVDDSLEEAYKDLVNDLKQENYLSIKNDLGLETVMSNPTEIKKMMRETYCAIVVNLLINQVKSTGISGDKKLLQRKFEELNSVLMSHISNRDKFVETILNFWNTEDLSNEI